MVVNVPSNSGMPKPLPRGGWGGAACSQRSCGCCSGSLPPPLRGHSAFCPRRPETLPREPASGHTGGGRPQSHCEGRYEIPRVEKLSLKGGNVEGRDVSTPDILDMGSLGPWGVPQNSPTSSCKLRAPSPHPGDSFSGRWRSTGALAVW